MEMPTTQLTPEDYYRKQQHILRFQLLKAALLKIQFFWNVMSSMFNHGQQRITHFVNKYQHKYTQQGSVVFKEAHFTDKINK